MEQSFIPYLLGFFWMSLFLLMGIYIRSKVPFFQKFLFPSAVIGGIIGFVFMALGWVGYPSPDGWKTLPPGTFGLTSFHLFSFGFGIIGLASGNQNNTGKSRDVLKGTIWVAILFWLFTGIQSSIGYGVTYIYNTMTEAVLEPAIGFLAGFGFAFGPGQAITVGTAWSGYGMHDAVPMSVAYAAIGFLLAVLVGVPLANWGVRKGYATFSSKELEIDFLIGLRPKDKRVSTGEMTTHSGNVDTFAMHFAIMCLVYGLAWFACYGLKYYVLPEKMHSASFGLIFLYALFIGMIVRRITKKSSAEKYYDDNVQNRILGTSIDYMILAAFMAVSMDAVQKYAVPFILSSLLCIAATTLLMLYLGRRVGIFGFERMLGVFGLVTGTAASGLALLRIADSEYKTSASIEIGANNIISAFILIPFIVFVVSMPVGIGEMGLLGIYLGFIFCCLGMLFFGHKTKFFGPRQF